MVVEKVLCYCCYEGTNMEYRLCVVLKNNEKFLDTKIRLNYKRFPVSGEIMAR